MDRRPPSPPSKPILLWAYLYEAPHSTGLRAIQEGLDSQSDQLESQSEKLEGQSKQLASIHQNQCEQLAEIRKLIVTKQATSK